MKEDRHLLSGEALPVANSAPLAAAGEGGTTEDTSLGAVYDSYLPLLRNIAMRKFHVPPSDVDSLIHDVFMTYLVQQERVRELHPYLIGGICNAAREYWRKAHRDRDLFCDASACAAAADDRVLESVPQNLLVRSAFARLGTSCRETLRRFYVDGESAAAIAASRETTQNSILQLLHYCRGRARAAYRALTEGKQ